MKVCDGLGCGGLDGIGNCQHPGGFSVEADEHGSLALRLQRHRLLFHCGQVADAALLKELELANDNVAVTDLAHDASARGGNKILHGLQFDTALFCAPNNGSGQRVFTILFDRRGGHQQFVFADTMDGKNLGEPWFAFRKRVRRGQCRP